MPQQGGVLATKCDNLSSSPRPHIVERENQLLPVVLWLSHMHVCVRACTHTHTHTNQSNVNRDFLAIKIIRIVRQVAK